MQLQFDTAIFIALLGGLLGYLAKIWMDHIRPFFEIIQVSGVIIKYQTKVAVSDALVNRLKDTIYITEIGSNEHLAYVQARFNRAEEI
jgi:hypothetical protein